jgi:NADPH-dependent 2,4-dienoyl-CoA reductase/sulfur reductase-like enzyme
VVSAEPVEGGLALALGDGTVLRVGLAVVGIGIRPDTRLAAAAGLAVDDGILVDDRCRSSDPRIFAAGDVARFGTRWCAGPVRLENWRHALDQGEVAGASAAGGNLAYGAVPSFWSDQYELRLQGVGWPDGLAAPVIRRSLGADRFLDFHLLDGRLRYAVGIGAGREIAIARRLIERRAPLDPLLLVDATKPLQALLRSGA